MSAFHKIFCSSQLCAFLGQNSLGIEVWIFVIALYRAKIPNRFLTATKSKSYTSSALKKCAGKNFKMLRIVNVFTVENYYILSHLDAQNEQEIIHFHSHCQPSENFAGKSRQLFIMGKGLAFLQLKVYHIPLK